MGKLSEELRESAKATFYDPLKSELNRAADYIDELEAALREIADSARLVGDYYHVKIARKALEENK